jgi:hypothetical protein
MIDLDDEQSFGLGLEREDTFNNFLKEKSLYRRFLWRGLEFLVNRIGYMPYAYFEREDVDEEIVQKLLKHERHLNAICKWIEDIDQEQLPMLREAKKLFEAIQKPKKRDNRLYRGLNLSFYEKLQGAEKSLYSMRIGETFAATPDKAMSFSSFSDVSKAYGNVIVTVNYDRESKRMLHITNEVMVAMNMSDPEAPQTIDEVFAPGRRFSYFESVFLPDGKPLEFTLLKK